MLIYNPNYNVTFLGIEKLHPFDSCKYKKIFAAVSHLGLHTVDPQREATREELLRVHTARYLDSLKSSSVVGSVCEMPFLAVFPNFLVNRSILSPMRYQVRGTIIAGEVAMRTGWAINLGGGMHHASSDDGGGWCVYSDIILSLMNLRDKTATDAVPVKKAMIIDLDVHQGNGHERDKLYLALESSVYTIDAYNPNLYPHDQTAMQAINKKIKVNDTTTDDQYLGLITDAIGPAMDSFHPQIIYYNAGTDILRGDPLGQVNISPDAVVLRDEIVFQAAVSRKIPIVMVLSGGYSSESAGVVTRSIINLHAKKLIA